MASAFKAGQKPAGVQARGLFGPTKVQALKVQQATGAGFFSDRNHCN